MFMSVEPTPYDLKWQMFGIPIRIHPTFWLIAVWFSWSLADLGLQFVLIGMACMLVSLLAHELAHALMFGYYGMRSVIFCYCFGGLAIPEGQLPVRSQRIAVMLAGPCANFLIAGIVWSSNQLEPWAGNNPYTVVIYLILFSINLFWGLLNLLPVHPLDGGQVSRELWIKSQGRSGMVSALKMSIAVAAGFAAYSLACHFNVIPSSVTPWWLRPGLFAGIMFAILAIQNYFQLQNQRQRP